MQNVRLSYIRGQWGGGGVGALHRLLGMCHCYVMGLHLTLKLPVSPLQLLHTSLLISWENLVLDQGKNFFLLSSSILIPCLLDNV